MSAPMAELVRVFGRIGVLSFGGPAAQIALMHRELVAARAWLDERQFLNALSFCMLLPGPEAMQLATYAGWRLRGVPGGLIAGGLFVAPGALVILVLALLYARIGDLALARALFLGVKATVVVVVIEALWRLSRRALGRRGDWAIAALSFLAIFAAGLPFPLIIAAAAAVGAWRGGGAAAPPGERHALRRTGATVAIWGALWLVPVAALWAADAGFLTDLALFFSKLAVVSFGGAYAVLAYMTQQVVEGYGWIGTDAMLDGLGLAETTPGPLILVTQFVGTLAGDLQGGWPLALMAGAVTLWVTFLPCFLWIFAGAPYIEWIASRPRLTGALGAITAAVVGVILNLSIWFAAHVFFAEVGRWDAGPVRLIVPEIATLDLRAVALALAAGGLLFGLGWPLPAVLGAAALAGLGLGQFG